MEKPLFIRLYRGSELVGIKQFQAEQVIFGREGEIDIALEGEDVSPIHALIEKRTDGFYVCDLGSENGTIFNGNKVLDQRIETGDSFEIGSYRIEFYIGIPKPKTKPPTAAVPPDPKIEKNELYDEPSKTTPTVPPIAPPSGDPAYEASSKLAEDKSKTLPKKPVEPLEEVTAEMPMSESEEPKEIERPAENVVYHSVASSEAQGETIDTGGSPNIPEHRPINSYRKKRTFAAPSKMGDINDRIKPEKGTTVEVVVAWKERILETIHYNSKKIITVGAHPKNDVILPVFGSSQASHPLIHIDSLASVFITPEMKGVLVQGSRTTPLDQLIAQGKAKKDGVGYRMEIQQGEMVRVDFDGGVSIFIRYVSQSPKPIMGPFFDLNTKELTTLVMVAGLTVLLALFMLVYEPDPIEETEDDEKLTRKATFVYKPPAPPIEPTVQPTPPPKKKVVKVVKRAKKKKVKRTRPRSAGKANDAPKTGKTTGPPKLTAKNPGKDKGIRRGGRVNRGKGQSAAGGKRKDVNTSGLLGAFAKNGTQDVLRSAVDGAGQVGGAAEQATGSGSKAAAGSGTTPGGGLSEVGKGGNGESTYGISGVQTKGRGGGNTGYGTGDLGKKSSVSIVPGGEEEIFEGGIDREEVRRVVLRNLKQLRSCYEQVTRVDPTVGGKVVFNWTIEAGGRVGTAKVASSEIKNKKMLNCMLSRLRSWRFPEPPEGQIGDVTYPFIFAAQQ